MPKSYPDVTRSGAASAKVQEEGRKPTTPASPELAPQLSPNSNTNFGRDSLLFFVQGEASPLEGSTHPWVKLSSSEVRNGLLFTGEETWESGGPPPLSRGAACLPTAL
jgi:hypothetical protein